MRKLPGIACDIDGVLIRGKKAIKQAILSMQRLRQPIKNIYPRQFSHIRQNMPFVCLSNSGGNLEQAKANQLNQLLGLKEASEILTNEHIILNFTPLRPIIQGYKDKSVLVVGRGKIEEIMEDCGVFSYYNMHQYNSYKKNLNFNEMKEFPEISAIFILNDPIDWEDNILLITKLLSKNPEIPIYTSHNDTLYSDEFPLPRFGIGGFNEVLLDISAKLAYKRYKLNYSGKPLALAFEFSKKRLETLANTFEISKFYMIGDNPNVDILGGRNNGFITILVKTGVFKEGDNDLKNPADFVAEDFDEAIRIIEKNEGIS